MIFYYLTLIIKTVLIASNTTFIVIGIAIGTFIGISLSFGGFHLYRWNKNKKERKKAISIPRNSEHKNSSFFKTFVIIICKDVFSNNEKESI